MRARKKPPGDRRLLFFTTESAESTEDERGFTTEDAESTEVAGVGIGWR